MRQLPTGRVGIIVAVLVALVIIAGGTVWTVQQISGQQISEQQISEQAESEDSTTQPHPPSSEQPELPSAPAVPPQDEPAIPEEDREQLEALAVEAAEVMTTWSPVEDFNQTDAELRAAGLMTEEQADAITAPERPATGPEWNAAAEAEATSQPSVEVNRATSSDVVAVIATWVWVTEDGDVVSNPSERRAFYFAFEAIDGELLISDYSWESL